ncbi:MAG: low-specificity L-threonine aldolase [Dehalococcoidia bacterium]|nr:low-specificity L-threonine aldolase [Dehalococcoidia bacterium]
MTRPIDLRSDTVTRPTPPMRAAMAAAEVGDDVFGDDPTVNRLEARAAEMVGKEAALFVPSGTMANLVALLAHTGPGDEVILGDQSHILHYEVGGVARIAGLVTRTLPNLDDGSLASADVEQAIRPQTIHSPGTRLLCLENTHNRCGGAALSAATTAELAGVARARGVAVHLDGARIFNASVALRTPVDVLAAPCDSVSFCFSKGLGAPVGSVLCGSREFIARARRFRKLLGGGMRQAGVLAAAALYALDHHIDRLVHDHENARRLAEGLASIGPFRPVPPQANIVVVDVLRGDVDDWLRKFEQAGVLAVGFGPGRFRMVTHLDVDRADIEEALARISRIAGATAH